ncbi:hypothetical protein [Streptomyces sp. NPDC017230]|uniref:hypothetical protein n=1 Tax=unclassified Streptomyces TaxID=2593676 RepID=UPI0037A463BD
MPEATPAPAETASSSAEPAEQTSEAPPEAPSANAEAAKFRRKLRDAESALEAAETRVNALLRKEIEAYAAKKLAVGADIFDIGKVDVPDLLFPNGDVDTETIDAAIEALLLQRPGLASNTLPWGEVQGGTQIAERGPTMHDALRFTGR